MYGTPLDMGFADWTCSDPSLYILCIGLLHIIVHMYIVHVCTRI